MRSLSFCQPYTGAADWLKSDRGREVLANVETALTAALATAIAEFTDNLNVIVPVTFGIAALTLVYRKVKGLVR